MLFRSVVLGAGRSDVERLSTPTSVLDVRVFEDEPRAHPILHPIHLTPHNAKQRPGIDQDFDSVLFHDLVEPIDSIEGEVREVVGESRAASVTDGDAEELWRGRVLRRARG